LAFKRKKIQTIQTVGARLQAERRKQKLDIEDVEEATKVRSKYLKAIESGNWNEFPSKIYVYGFVKRYAEFLGLDSEKVNEDFKAEFGTNRVNIFSKKNEGLSDRIVITPRVLIISLVVVLFVGLVSYIFISAKKVSRPPEIEILAPKEEVTSKTEISIEGKTSNTAIVEINGQLVNVDDKGYFKQKTALNEGVNIFEIKAKSRVGKEESKEIKILKTK
jgi:cytoskeletal protein RodZ